MKGNNITVTLGRAQTCLAAIFAAGIIAAVIAASAGCGTGTADADISAPVSETVRPAEATGKQELSEPISDRDWTELLGLTRDEIKELMGNPAWIPDDGSAFNYEDGVNKVIIHFHEKYDFAVSVGIGGKIPTLFGISVGDSAEKVKSVLEGYPELVLDENNWSGGSALVYRNNICSWIFSLDDNDTVLRENVSVIYSTNETAYVTVHELDPEQVLGKLGNEIYDMLGVRWQYPEMKSAVYYDVDGFLIDFIYTNGLVTGIEYNGTALAPNGIHIGT